MGFLALSDVDARIPMSTKYARPFFLEEPAIQFPEIVLLSATWAAYPVMKRPWL